MGDQKQSLREKALHQREAWSTSGLNNWNRAIQERALSLPAYVSSRSVGLYSPIGNEVETVGICDHALRNGKTVYYPRVSGEKLGLVRVDSCGGLKASRNGILDPPGNSILTEQNHGDLVLFIPGLAFDLEGNRLGRGGGWYDRTLMGLGKKPRRVALAYEFQIVGTLPVEDWDQKVHQIITETRVISCSDTATAHSGC